MKDLAKSNKNLPQEKKLIISLSGGGFRAMLFHFGALLYLKKSKMFNHICEINSVSGGSLLCGTLLHHWNSLSLNDSNNEWFTVFKKIKKISQINLRGLYLNRKLILLNTNIIEKKYNEILFDNKTVLIKELNDVPKFRILCTNLKYADICFFSNKEYVYYKNTSTNEKDTKLRISTPIGNFTMNDAILCSSLHPLLLKTKDIDSSSFRKRESELNFSEIHPLQDGGIFDNLGVNVVFLEQTYSADKTDKSLELILDPNKILLVSDAESKIDWTQPKKMGVLRRLKRSIDVSMSLTSRLLNDLLIEKNSNILISKNTNSTLKNIRTDLNSFCNEEIYLLIRHGYEKTQQTMETSYPLLKKSDFRQTKQLFELIRKDLCISEDLNNKSVATLAENDFSSVLNKQSKKWGILFQDWPMIGGLSLSTFIFIIFITIITLYTLNPFDTPKTSDADRMSLRKASLTILKNKNQEKIISTLKEIAPSCNLKETKKLDPERCINSLDNEKLREIIESIAR